MITNHYIKLIIIIFFLFHQGCNKTDQAPFVLRPQITLTTTPESIAIDDSFLLDIHFANLENLFASSFEISFNQSYLEVLDVEQGFNDYANDNIGPFYYLEDGFLSIVLGGNNIDGKIISFTMKGNESTLPGKTALEFNKIHLIQPDGTYISNINSLISRGVEITVTE